MKVRRTLSIALIALTTALASNSAVAGNDENQKILTALTNSFVENAMLITQNELDRGIKTDVLTASHHVSPDKGEAVYVAKIDIKDIKDKG